MIELRLAAPDDAAAVAVLFRRSRALLTFLPELHTAEEDLWFVRNVLIGEQRVTLAERHGKLAGFMAEADGWITQLYLDPDLRRKVLEQLDGLERTVRIRATFGGEPAVSPPAPRSRRRRRSQGRTASAPGSA